MVLRFARHVVRNNFARSATSVNVELSLLVRAMDVHEDEVRAFQSGPTS